MNKDPIYRPILDDILKVLSEEQLEALEVRLMKRDKYLSARYVWTERKSRPEYTPGT